MLENQRVLVLGAGDLATGVIRRLHLAGARVVATELPSPLTVRRPVSFSEAVHASRHTVEGVTAVRCEESEIDAAWRRGEVPVLVDPGAAILRIRAFEVLVDARMAKRNLGITRGDAPVVIALGPGFTAGKDCHAVVETLQGAGMGRVLYTGSASQAEGPPTPLDLPGGSPSGLDPERRVLRAPRSGVLHACKEIGAEVEEGEAVAEVEGEPVEAGFGGVLRGLVRDGLHVDAGLKIGEVELPENAFRVFRISEKANAVAGGVLEACFVLLGRGA